MYDLQTIVKMNEDTTWKDKNISQKDYIDIVKKDLLQRASIATDKTLKLRPEEVVIAVALQNEGQGKLSVTSALESYFSVKGYETISLDKKYKTADGGEVQLFTILRPDELSSYPVFGMYTDSFDEWVSGQWTLKGESISDDSAYDLVEVK